MHLVTVSVLGEHEKDLDSLRVSYENIVINVDYTFITKDGI